jgi:hypothetical protein
MPAPGPTPSTTTHQTKAPLPLNSPGGTKSSESSKTGTIGRHCISRPVPD